jgi:hypothetical protein
MATYTKPTISNYNDNPPSNDGSTSSFVDNGVDWDRHIDEIGDPLNSYSDAINNETSSSFDKFDESIYKSVKKDYNATGDGSTDDTLAIQAAIDSGQSLYFPPGIYKVSSTLNLLTVNNHGQILRGAGSIPINGSGGSLSTRTIFQPTSAVTKLFVIDGTSFSNFMQHVKFRDFSIDMVNMTDVDASCAFNQVRAWGCGYDNITTPYSGLGSNKRGWIFNAGAYTTVLRNCSTRIFEMTGLTDGDQVTTITLLGCGNEQYIFNYASAINITGGALQGSVVKMTGYTDGISGTLGGIRNVTGLMVRGLDVEGTGDYIHVGSGCNALYSFGNQITGLSGATYTFNSAPSYPFILEDTPAGGTNTFFRDTGKFKMWNSDADADSFFLSGGATSYYNISIGRTGADMTVGVAGATNDIITGSAQGDAIIAAAQLMLYGGKHKFVNQMAITRKVLTYSASVDVDLSDGNEFELSPTDGVNFSINNPTNTVDGQIVTFRLRNDAGMGTITWGSEYHMAAWTNPASIKSRAITFQVIESGSLHEITRTENDIPL